MIHAEGLTVRQLAMRLGVSERAVRKKTGLDEYCVGQITGHSGGRPAPIYDPKAIDRLWPERSPAAEEKTRTRATRKGRADCGLPRKCTLEQWNTIVQRTFDLYMGSAQGNLKMACEEAVRQLTAEGVDVPLDIYKRLTKKRTDHNGQYISEYYRQNWELLRRSAWRKKDTAIAMATARYDWLSVFESAGWAGEGFGALRGWSIDVRKNDVWTRDADGSHLMPSAIYIRDALTGYPLWCEPIRTETTEALIRAYMNCGLAWGRFPDLLVAIDNGRAMIADRTVGVIKTTLPEEAWENAARWPAIFGRETPSPVLQNLPNIPQSQFKAALERSFRLIKDEYDAPRYPALYQGGDRKEAVQLTLAAMPTFPKEMLSSAEYFGGLMQWLYSDYIRRERPRAFPSAQERGIAPTIEAVFEYYGGYKAQGSLPSGDKLAHLLYWTTERPSIVKAKLRYVDATINGRYNRWLSDALDVEMYGHKVAVLPLPGREDDMAVLMQADDRKHPRFLGIAQGGVVRHIDRVDDVKRHVADLQRQTRDELRERRVTSGATWQTHTEPRAIPAGPTQASGEMHHPTTEATNDDHEVNDFTAPPVVVDDDTAELLRDAQRLLD